NASWLTLSPTTLDLSVVESGSAGVCACRLDEAGRGSEHGGSQLHRVWGRQKGADRECVWLAAGSGADVHRREQDDAERRFQRVRRSSGAVSFEAQHATRNNSVGGMVWRTLPGLGKTLSGVTPFPRLGNNENNFTAGAGPSLEYDFYTFSGGANVTVVTYLSPSGNALGADRPLGFAVQLDDAPAQSNYFFPSAAPGLEPAQWNGFVAAEIIQTRTCLLRSLLFMIEPAWWSRRS
ncbi:unnamed protein product, partial [Mycena citricolor]